jgi:single-strand DNA-binding protein
MGSLNKVQLIGRLGKAPQLRQISGDKSVANFSLATSTRFNDKEQTEWHNVTAWGKTAENAAKYLVKGSEVYVEGRLQTRSYDKDGQKHYATSIVAEQIIFLGGGKSKGQSQEQQPQGDSEDMPF